MIITWALKIRRRLSRLAGSIPVPGTMIFNPRASARARISRLRSANCPRIRRYRG